MKKHLGGLFMGGALLMAMSQQAKGDDFYYREKKAVPKTPLTSKQKKARKKARMAKVERRKNR